MSGGHELVAIKASCPFCGQVDLQPLWVVVRTWSGASSHWNRYEFTCRKCGQDISKPARPEVIDLLVEAGVPRQHTEVPDECDDPHRSTFLPPISEDDVLDLINELQQQERP